MTSRFQAGRASIRADGVVYLVLLHTDHADRSGHGLELVVQKNSGEIIDTRHFEPGGDGQAIDCWRIAIVDLIRRVSCGGHVEMSIDSWPTRPS